MGFSSSSVGKEYACIAGDPGSISGSGRSTGEAKLTHTHIYTHIKYQRKLEKKIHN